MSGVLADILFCPDLGVLANILFFPESGVLADIQADILFFPDSGVPGDILFFPESGVLANVSPVPASGVPADILCVSELVSWPMYHLLLHPQSPSFLSFPCFWSSRLLSFPSFLCFLQFRLLSFPGVRRSGRPPSSASLVPCVLAFHWNPVGPPST